MIRAVFIFTLTVLFACKSKQASTPSAQVPLKEVAEQQAPTGLNPGNKAPEISLKDPKDSVIALSSIKDKLILIDFWASWCGPCRHENPIVVAAYNTYKNKKFKNGNGFTIYSVSLDMDKGRWKQAIANDKLEWPYHVSDLKMWGSSVVPQYNIQGIPTNVLINNKGIIIATNLRGDALTETLEKNLIKE